MGLTATLHGLREMTAKIKNVRQRFPDRVALALRQEAEIEMTEAKRRTPVWNSERPVPPGHVPGSLRASGKVLQPERGAGRRIIVELVFTESYAIYVHEDLDAFHETGQAKFLESTLNESAPFMAHRLAERLQLNRMVVE